MLQCCESICTVCVFGANHCQQTSKSEPEINVASSSCEQRIGTLEERNVSEQSGTHTCRAKSPIFCCELEASVGLLTQYYVGAQLNKLWVSLALRVGPTFSGSALVAHQGVKANLATDGGWY